MVLVVLEISGARYGVPASRIVEVVPAPLLHPLPGTPEFIAGVFSYHGDVVPVIDLPALVIGRPSRALLSTRLLLFLFHRPQTAKSALMAVMAEHITETIVCSRSEFQPAGVQGDSAPYAGDILVRADGLVQELDLDRILTPELQEQLFPGALAQI